jgi:hypothetical protein
MKINDDVKFAILLIAVIASMVAMFIQPKHVIVTYDCRVAEFSPDVPPMVKEQCRRKMGKN